MPNRRSIGRGLMSASALLGDYFQRQSQEASIRERQVLDDKRAAEAARLAREDAERRELERLYLSQNPSTLANRLGRGRPNEDVAAPLSEMVTKADSLSKMPTDEDILTQYVSGGGRQTLDSRNITRSGSNLVSTPNQGGASVLEGLKSQAKAKREMLTTEANMPTQLVEEVNPDGSKTKKPYSLRTGTAFTSGLSAAQEGKLEGDKSLAAEPGKTEAENRNLKGTWDVKFVQAEKLEQMKARIELNKARELYKINHPEAANAAANAIEATIGMEKIIGLAFELNKQNTPGVTDVYAGAKNAIGQLPYVGTSIASLMDTASSARDFVQSGDPTIPMKVNTLQGLRRAAAISLIKAAGDPRPSNADVEGVMGSIPGYDESVSATALKAKIMRDTALLLPQVMASNPGVTGKALLDIVVTEAKKRSQDAAQITQPADPSTKVETSDGTAVPPPSGRHEQSRFGTQAPHLTRPGPQTPSQRLQRLREQRRRSGG